MQLSLGEAGMGRRGRQGGGMVSLLRNPIDSTLFTETTQREHLLHLKHPLQSNEVAHLSSSDMKESDS